MKKSIINVTRRMMPVLMVAVMSVSTAQAQEIYKIESNPVTVQLHTNGLYDLALCPNVGVELQTEIGLAFQLDYVGAWWNSPSRNRFYSNYAFQTELRYYLDHKDDAFAFDGWHAGLYGQMATYDFEFGGGDIRVHCWICPSVSVRQWAIQCHSLAAGQWTLRWDWDISNRSTMYMTRMPGEATRKSTRSC